MKKSLIFCSLLVLTACLLTLSVFASAGSDYIDYRAEQEAEERADLPKIVGDKYSYGELFEEDAGTEHDNYDPKNYIRVYKMQSISKDTLKDIRAGELSFTEFLSDDYNYTYVHPDFNWRSDALKNSEGVWEAIRGGSSCFKSYREAIPGKADSFEGMINYIAESHPAFDPESVRFIDAISYLSANLLYFTENRTEYVGFFSYGNDHVVVENGSILTVDEFLDSLDADGYLKPRSREEVACFEGLVYKEASAFPWVTVTVVTLFVVIGVLAIVIISGRRKKSAEVSDVE